MAILIFLKRNNGCFHRVWLWGSSFKFDQKNMFWKHKRAAEGPVPWRPAVPRLSDGDYAMICKMKQTASLVDFLFSTVDPAKVKTDVSSSCLKSQVRLLAILSLLKLLH